MSRGYLELLRNNSDFSKLWLAQVVSLLGDWFNFVVLASMVSRFSNNSGEAISIYLLARFLPPLIVSPYAGVIVDRFNRKYVLIASDISRAIVVPLFLLVDSPDLLWLIYLLTVIQFALSAVFEPGRNAIIPSLLPREDLVAANTLSSVTWSVMLAGGAVAGGLVAESFGAATTLLIDSATFFVSALLIVGITPRYQHKAESESDVKISDDRSFREGLRYLRRHSEIAAATFVKSGLSIGNIDAALIIYGTELFVRGQDGILSMSILWSAFGVGAVVGPLLTNRINDGSVQVMRRLIIIGYIAVVAGWFVFGGAPTLLLAAFALVIRGAGGSINWTYSSIIIQKETPDEYLGRMFAIDMAGFQLMTTISIIVTGQVLEHLGSEQVREVVIGTGFLSLLPLALWILLTRHLERNGTKSVAPVIAGD
ncbi:MAG: MFS transporter [Chloroflexi bacterium]|nr:MAG: hypothetical protein CUN54_06690 [Phototrophicales bacterium]RMF80493.1 MAG: MFS transporter [Chloroflexota bacterium]